MKRFNEPILVPRPYLSLINDFEKRREEIWANQWLTKNGPMLRWFQMGDAGQRIDC